MRICVHFHQVGGNSVQEGEWTGHQNGLSGGGGGGHVFHFEGP